jgi:hypothetical protein
MDYKNINYKEYVSKVNTIIEKYKISIAKIVKNGSGTEIVQKLNDVGIMKENQNADFLDVIQSSIQSTTSEEMFIDRVNFAFSLLTEKEKSFMYCEYLFPHDELWWIERYSRSTYYRYKKKISFRFIEYFDQYVD